MSAGTNSPKLTRVMRDRCIDLPARRVLIARLTGSEQEADLSLPPNCNGLGRIRHFSTTTHSGWPPNPLPIVPASRWLKKPASDRMTAEVFQLAGCSMRCWYCFVPFKLLSGDVRLAEWVTAEQLVHRYMDVVDRPSIIVLSGGSPDIVPEWILWTMQALKDAGVANQTYLWSDDNLSNDLLLRDENRRMVEQIEFFPGYGKVCCLKGIDATSFEFTTGGAAEGFEQQIRILEGYLESSIDLYGYVTLAAATGPDPGGAIRRLFDRIQAVREDFIGRIVPLRIERFGAMNGRVDDVRERTLSTQDDLVALWLDEIAARKAQPVWEQIS